jgi:transcriptional regulator with XRE-family HTH domain
MQKSLHSRHYKVFLVELRDARTRLGVTQGELAARLDATQSFVSKCERGERRLDVIELQLWCKALGLRMPDFVKQLERRLDRSR